MAPSFVTSMLGYTELGNEIVFTNPGGIQEGDLLMAFIGVVDAGGFATEMTGPENWLRESYSIFGEGNTHRRFHLFSYAGASVPGTFTFTHENGDVPLILAGIIVVYRNPYRAAPGLPPPYSAWTLTGGAGDDYQAPDQVDELLLGPVWIEKPTTQKVIAVYFAVHDNVTLGVGVDVEGGNPIAGLGGTAHPRIGYAVVEETVTAGAPVDGGLFEAALTGTATTEFVADFQGSAFVLSELEEEEEPEEDPQAGASTHGVGSSTASEPDPTDTIAVPALEELEEGDLLMGFVVAYNIPDGPSEMAAPDGWASNFRLDFAGTAGETSRLFRFIHYVTAAEAASPPASYTFVHENALCPLLATVQAYRGVRYNEETPLDEQPEFAYSTEDDDTESAELIYNQTSHSFGDVILLQTNQRVILLMVAVSNEDTPTITTPTEGFDPNEDGVRFRSQHGNANVSMLLADQLYDRGPGDDVPVALVGTTLVEADSLTLAMPLQVLPDPEDEPDEEPPGEEDPDEGEEDLQLRTTVHASVDSEFKSLSREEQRKRTFLHRRTQVRTVTSQGPGQTRIDDKIVIETKDSIFTRTKIETRVRYKINPDGTKTVYDGDD